MYPGQYAGQSPQYSSPSTADPRYVAAPVPGSMGAAYQMQTEPVAVGAYQHGSNYRVSDQYSADRMNVDSGPRYTTSAQQQPYQTSQGYAYQQAPAGSAGYAQPVDNFYGRGAYPATTTPTTQAPASDFLASPASNLPVGYSPTPDPTQYEESQPQPPLSRPATKVSSAQAQTGSSGSSRRDRDQRDSRDATEKRSRHHHYR